MKNNLNQQIEFISKLLLKTSCPSCSELIKHENIIDSRSRREFIISGFCQDCQNITFK